MISVVIPTRNRARLLEVALASLVGQTLPSERFEVLVVDNGSTDETQSVVFGFKAQLSNLVYHFCATPGLHAGRHVGLRYAKGDDLVFVDDDIRALPSWLQAIYEDFRDADVALVGGNNFPDFEESPPAWLDLLWHRGAYGGKAVSFLSVLALPEGRVDHDPDLVWGCNFAIRKSVLLDAGGFHPDGMPESLIRFRGDGESHVTRYIKRQGLRCRFDWRASVYHRVTRDRMTFEYFRKRAFDQGISDSYTQLREGGANDVERQALPLRWLRCVGGDIKRRVVDAIRPAQPEQQDPELEALQRVISEGYQEGLEFHRRAYRDDPEVRAWVHRKDYF